MYFISLLQAIFEVVTSEEEHLAAMETLVNHYMSDSGLDPSLPEQQRVLSEEEYNDIFRYVNDVHQISEGYVLCGVQCLSMILYRHSCVYTCVHNDGYAHAAT